jgi:hypothetical protein
MYFEYILKHGILTQTIESISWLGRLRFYAACSPSADCEGSRKLLKELPSSSALVGKASVDVFTTTRRGLCAV